MRWFWFVMIVLLLGLARGAHAQAKLAEYETSYYIIHTDLEGDDVREAAIRMTKMFEEYRERTRAFSGQVRKKLPFYLFRKAEDYYQAGGIPGSAGVFMGEKLMAIAGEKTGSGTWHVIQHEGFHQFARATIGGQIPTWANEGMAEYFAEAVFTGDGYVVGLVPPGRLRRVKKLLEEKRFMPLEQMMIVTQRQWNAGLSSLNYDQAWMMTHFLAHGEDGRYQKAFVGFFLDINAGRTWKQAWVDNFGGDVEAFENRWREYWLNLPENPTEELYLRATAATLTSFLARAVSQKQMVNTFEEFVAMGASGEGPGHHPEDWLPTRLLTSALRQAKSRGQWTIEMDPRGGKRLIASDAGSPKWIGSFVVDRGRVIRVMIESPSPGKREIKASAPATIATTRPTTRSAASSRIAVTRPTTRTQIDPLRTAISLAKAYETAGDRERARHTLEKGIRENPESPALPEAKRTLKEMQ